MTDYGHELRFGTFITPSSARVAEVVRLARLSDRLGYELITFQDHKGGKTLSNSTKRLVEAADVTLPECHAKGVRRVGSYPACPLRRGLHPNCRPPDVEDRLA